MVDAGTHGWMMALRRFWHAEAGFTLVFGPVGFVGLLGEAEEKEELRMQARRWSECWGERRQMGGGWGGGPNIAQLNAFNTHKI